jgi:hypothetical protein
MLVTTEFAPGSIGSVSALPSLAMDPDEILVVDVESETPEERLNASSGRHCPFSTASTPPPCDLRAILTMPLI